MKRAFPLAILLFLISNVTLLAQKTGIGLALSGGGAKGLSHIGILQALDSAGLHVDYVTGTSMGSIIGGLYAAGYSGKQIEEIARKIEWSNIFTGKPSFRNVSIEEKDEFQEYAIELPVENGNIKLPSAILEAEELWLVLGEMFFPVYDKKDFSKLSIPFKCVAADLSTGNAVVLDSGEIIKAVRSSMAIPSVFTAIDYNDTKLVDGGVVRNLPVSDLLNMGANYCIGVNLNRGLDPASKLNTSLDVLLQIAFFRDNLDFEKEKGLCNILIEPPMGTYSAGSFANADDLIRIGKETGRKYYPYFKHLADSLGSLDSSGAAWQNRIPKVESLVIDNIEVKGLRLTTLNYFTDKMNIHPGRSYTAAEITEAIRKTFGSRRYNRIAFFFDPTQPGHARLRLEVIENPAAYVKAGIHYNTATNFSAIVALSFRDVLIKNSQTNIKANIGNSMRLFFQHTQPLFKVGTSFVFDVNYSATDMKFYKDYSAQVVYNASSFEANLALAHQFSSSMMAGIGAGFSNLGEIPKVDPVYNLKKDNSFWSPFLFLKRNTLDRKHYPREGWDLYAKTAYILGQNARVDTLNSESGKQSLDFGNYFLFDGKVEHYFPLSKLSNLRARMQVNLNVNATDGYMNEWSVGGMTDFLRNQVTFAGLMENEILTQSVAVLDANYRYQFSSNLYLNGTVNVALHSFIDNPGPITASDNFISGYGMGISYDSPIGPLEFTAIYCDQSKTFNSYINLGYHF